jgi:hypothetical protein
MTAPPAAEALTLSATLFHVDVDSWLPANFGVQRTLAERESDWETALRGSARDRLGLGHPDLEDAGGRARAATARAGIEALRRVQKKKRDEGDEAEGLGQGGKGRGGDGSDSEDESRTRAVKKRKATVDVFGKPGKSKKKAVNAVHPLLIIKNPIPGYEPGAEDESGNSDGAAAAATTTAPATATAKVSAATAEAASAPIPAPEPVAPSTATSTPKATVAAADAPSAPAAPASDAADADELDTTGMSKTQARREKRKRAKVRKADGAA